MKNLTVGKRILLGFAAQISIAMILGIISIIQMGAIEKGSSRLTQAHLPEVNVSNAVERHLTMAMYAMRGYAFGEDDAYYAPAMDELAKTLQHLDAVKALAEGQNLQALLKAEPEMRRLVLQYQASADSSRKALEQIRTLRSTMNTTAQSFENAAGALLRLQEQATERVMREQTQKIT
jgi:CHASE3 domain sensor protein